MSLTEALLIVATLIAVAQPVSARTELLRIGRQRFVGLAYMFISCGGWLSLFLLLLHVLTIVSYPDFASVLRYISLYIILICVLIVLAISAFLEFSRKLNIITPEGRQDQLFENFFEELPKPGKVEGKK